MNDPSTETALREMSRTIGGLESTVKNLVDTWSRQEAQASQARHELQSKFDALSRELQILTAKVDQAVKDLAAMQPSVEAFENAKQQARGAQKLGRWLWGAVTVASGAIGWIGHWLWTPKPPIH